MAKTATTPAATGQAGKTSNDLPPSAHDLPIGVADIVSQFSECSNKFGELAALFMALADALNKPELAKYAELLSLSNLGNYVARDFENLAGWWGEEVQRQGWRP